MTHTAPKRAVYTALIGGYELLLEQPVALNSTLPFICLTDDPSLTSETWDIRIVEPAFPQDSIRSARALKIRGHPILAEFDETLWIDNTVLLKAEPTELLDQWLAHADLALPVHSFRENVAAEFDVVASQLIDDPARVNEQRAHYAASSPDVLKQRVHWTAVLARRATPSVQRLMLRWFDEVLRHSRRDQLSIGLALSSADFPVFEIDVDNFASDWHEWPKALGRRRQPRDEASSRVPWVEAAAQARERDQLTFQAVRAVSAREEIIVGLEQHIVGLEQQIAAIHASRTWRLGSRLATMLSPMRGLLIAVHRR